MRGLNVYDHPAVQPALLDTSIHTLRGREFSILYTETKEEQVNNTFLVPEWSTLIGPDPRDTVLSLVEPYSAGANACKIPSKCTFSCVVMA